MTNKKAKTILLQVKPDKGKPIFINGIKAVRGKDYTLKGSIIKILNKNLISFNFLQY